MFLEKLAYCALISAKSYSGTCLNASTLLKVHKDLIETVAMLRQQGFDVHLQIGGEDEKGGTGYRQER